MPGRMTRWILPALGYIALTGALGITTKLALASTGWKQLLVWAALAYAVFSGLFLLTGTRPHFGQGIVWAALSGILAASTFALYMVAVGRGEVSKTVPFMSAYPVVTVLLSVVVLSEQVKPAQIAGVCLVIGGLVLLAR
jgi:bacterial/archaeal transporter family protein